jgi:putative heme-binding domain-containing protein
MDNPVDVAFMPGGERIFTTTFLQHPAAGRRDGLIHAVYGGVYGKVHDVIDGHVRTGPELMPVLAHLGPSASCGLTRYESAAFGMEYADNLFSCSFNLHKVFRHVITPDGATFKSRDEDFVACDHVDFHPTDIIEDADGSLLIVDTGGWYKLCCPTSQLGKPDVLGAIYRVRRTDGVKVEDPRGLRIEWEKLTAAELASMLGDERPAVRKRAMAAIGKMRESVPALAKLVDSSPVLRARLSATWVLCQIDDPAARAALREFAITPDADVRNVALHAIGLWRDRGAVEALFEPLARPAPATRRAAAEALGRIGDARAVPKLLAAFTEPVDRVLEHSLIYALIEIGDARAVAAFVGDENVAVRRAAMIALDQLGGLQPDVVAAELSSADAALREAAAWIVTRHADWGETLAKTLRQRMEAPNLGDAERADLRRQLSNLAAGSSAIQQLLVEVAGDVAAPLQRRQVALGAMGQTGFKEVPQAWLDGLTKLLGDADAAIAGAAAGTLRKLNPKNAAALMADLLKAAGRADLADGARLDSLAVLPAHTSKEARPLPAALVEFVVGNLDTKKPAPQRLAAAEVLGRSKLGREQWPAVLGAVRVAGPLELDRILSAFDQASADDAVALKLIAALGETKASASLRVDALRVRLKRFGPDVQEKAKPLLARLAPDAAAQRAHLDELAAKLGEGDVRRGQLVFNSTKAACASCHAIGYLGGHVGPDLTRIGSIRQERDLLESIVYPSASFVQSFEPVIVSTVDGDVQAGLLRKNDGEEVVLLTGPDQERRIPRKDVEDMRPGTTSLMPAGLDQQLSGQELADLVAFLRACK